MKKLVSFLTLVGVGVLTAGAAFAQGGSVDPKVGSALAWGAGIIMAIAPAMGTFSQSRAATAALEGISRNPQAADRIQTPLILSLALMESLVIFSLVIAFFLQGKI